MKEMDRRDFVKTVAIGGAFISLGRAVFPKPVLAEVGGKWKLACAHASPSPPYQRCVDGMANNLYPM
jgi:hypothetical protein